MEIDMPSWELLPLGKITGPETSTQGALIFPFLYLQPLLVPPRQVFGAQWPLPFSRYPSV